nr:ketoacyl-ACP synthase III [uncultured Dethiosulfovibrio sp.]
MIFSCFWNNFYLSNAKLETIYSDPSWTAKKILRKTGIASRPTAGEMLVSDMAVKAAENLFEEHDIDRNSIDYLLLCTQSPDYYLPTTACMVQDRLGLPTSIGALDFNLGCSGFVYGLSMAKGLIAGGVAKKVLLITSETYTKHIHPMDRSTRTIFGDGSSATMICQEDLPQIGSFSLGTDGSGYRNLIVPSGGMALPRTAETAQAEADESGNIRSKDNLYMNGPEIFSFTLRAVPGMVKDVLDKNGLTQEDIDLFVFHQANRFILETLRDKLSITHDRFVIDVEDIGNTVSSTIPIALKRAITRGQIKEGSKVLIAGFGVGYSWGATILDF